MHTNSITRQKIVNNIDPVSLSPFSLHARAFWWFIFFSRRWKAPTQMGNKGKKKQKWITTYLGYICVHRQQVWSLVDMRTDVYHHPWHTSDCIHPCLCRMDELSWGNKICMCCRYHVPSSCVHTNILEETRCRNSYFLLIKVSFFVFFLKKRMGVSIQY